MYEFSEKVDPVMAAVEASGEYDSDTTNDPLFDSGYTGRHCARCNKFEEDTGDGPVESGGSPRAVPSDNLAKCKECDCYAHRDCLIAGRCPHCAYMERAEEQRAGEAEMNGPDNIIGRTSHAIISDLKEQVLRANSCSATSLLKLKRDCGEMLLVIAQILRAEEPFVKP